MEAQIVARPIRLAMDDYVVIERAALRLDIALTDAKMGLRRGSKAHIRLDALTDAVRDARMSIESMDDDNLLEAQR